MTALRTLLSLWIPHTLSSAPFALEKRCGNFLIPAIAEVYACLPSGWFDVAAQSPGTSSVAAVEEFILCPEFGVEAAEVTLCVCVFFFYGESGQSDATPRARCPTAAAHDNVCSSS